MLHTVFVILISIFLIAITTYNLIIGDTVNWWEIFSLVVAGWDLGIVTALMYAAWLDYKAQMQSKGE